MLVLIGIVIILTIVIAILMVCLINMKLNIKGMAKDLRFINSEETNATIRTSTSDKDIIDLSKAINENIECMNELRKKVSNEETKIVATITNLSHDLRTPLTSILGYTQLFQKEELNEKQKEYIKVIDERIKHLRGLVDELYEYSLSYNEKEIELEKVNIAPLLEETLLLFYNDFNNKNYNVDFKIEEEIIKIIDVNMVKRVFYNIISNALKYGKDFFKVEYINDTFIFSNVVVNTDIIDVEKIFDRFFTVAKARNNGSSGLGLAISKKIVEDLGGSIKASLSNNILSVYIKLK